MHVILNKHVLFLQLILVLPEYDVYKYVCFPPARAGAVLSPQCLFATFIRRSSFACFHLTSNPSLLCRRFGRPNQALQQFCGVTQRDRHLELFGFEREPVNVVQAGRSFGYETALVHQQRGEEEELYFGQLLSNAPALPHGKYQHVGGQVFVKSSVLVQEALGFERLWLVPFVGMVV